MLIMQFELLAHATDNVIEDKFGLSVEQAGGKLLIIAINENSRTTLMVNDEIVEVNGRKVLAIDEYRNAINYKSAEYEYFKVIRNGDLVLRAAKNLKYQTSNTEQLNQSSKARVDKNNEEVIIENAKVKCEKIGFKADTADFTNCVFKLYTNELDARKQVDIPTNNTADVQTRQVDEDALRREKALLMLQYLNTNKPYQIPAPQVYQLPIRPSVNTNCTTYGNQTNCTTR